MASPARYPAQSIYVQQVNGFSTKFFVPTVTGTFRCYNHLRSNTIIFDYFLSPIPIPINNVFSPTFFSPASAQQLLFLPPCSIFFSCLREAISFLLPPRQQFLFSFPPRSNFFSCLHTVFSFLVSERAKKLYRLSNNTIPNA